MRKPKIGVIVGSTSRVSINRRLSGAIRYSGRDLFEFEEIPVADLPLYNRDMDADLPRAVQDAKRQIEGVEGILIVSPEYNRSLPSALKNLLDWGSRPYGKSSWRGKCAAIAGASTGALGTAVSQTHLRTVLTHLDVVVLPQPELYIQWREGLLNESNEPNSPEFNKILDTFSNNFFELLRRNG